VVIVAANGVFSGRRLVAEWFGELAVDGLEKFFGLPGSGPAIIA